LQREETKMRIVGTTITGQIAKLRGVGGLAARAAVVGGCALFLCACNTDQQIAAVPDVPSDYRQRHPITISEANHTLQLFVGTSRGELNAAQRAEVAQFGHRWRREATGGVAIELPVGASNERAAAESVPMIRSILAATSVPPNGIVVRGYPAPGPNIAPIRVSYPRIAGQVGPCGLWPEDIGPSYTRNHFENQPVWNAGCATQRNLAAMVDNPADLVQPRGETPAYNMRRTTVLEKYRSGNSPATQYPETNSGKISDLGK
jgi:pilus assembly protein CpaD